MFWTDWGLFNSKIERATLSGENRTVFVDLTYSIQWYPYGLVINFDDDRLYWFDALVDVVESVTLDGTDRQRLRFFDEYLSPFSLTVLDDVLYWSDLNSRTIERLNTTNGHHLQSYGWLGYHHIYGIALYDASREPKGKQNSYYLITTTTTTITTATATTTATTTATATATATTTATATSTATATTTTIYVLLVQHVLSKMKLTFCVGSALE